MPEVTVTLENVESKDVKVRGEDATVYEFKASDGRKYTTFKRDVAVPGATLRGRLVTIVYTEKKKGDFTNYYLESITAAVGDPGVLVDLRGDAPGTWEKQDAQTESANIRSAPDKDVSIARAVALKAAVESATGFIDIDTATDVLNVADVYVDWLLTGAVNAEPVAVGSDENFPF